MRRLLALACRAFPRNYRARQSGELVDTALLAADGSPWRTAREALSLVAAGLRQRLRATEGDTSIRDGVAALAGLIAVVNLAVALYGISFAVRSAPPFAIRAPLGFSFPPDPRAVDWWWIALAIAAAGVVVGLALGSRRLALGAALANLGLVGYDAIHVAANWYGFGHLNAVAYLRGSDGYPVGQEWLAPAVVLVLATAAAPPGRLRFGRLLPLALVASVLLVVLARHDSSGFIFLRWPLAVFVLVALMLGWRAPQLAVVVIGVSVALAPSVIQYLSSPSWEYKAPAVSWIAAPGLALGILLSLAYLTRRRLT